MESIVLRIVSCDFYKYDQIELKQDCLKHIYGPQSLRQNKLTKKTLLALDSAFVYYLIKELDLCNFYRKCFIANISKWHGPDYIVLEPTKTNLIDYNWNERVYLLVREKCELEYALSWLSTFGGAFSALGDYFADCADTAGRISIRQLQLAYRLGDPTVASRCRLYLSLSLIQKKKFKVAARIIRSEYQKAKVKIIGEQMRLVRMCQGIWSKLKYEHGLYRNTKKIKML